jgi:hypothetical protein
LKLLLVYVALVRGSAAAGEERNDETDVGWNDRLDVVQ